MQRFANILLLIFVVGFYLEATSQFAVLAPSPCLIKLGHKEQTAHNYQEKDCPAFLAGSLILLGRLDHFIEAHDKSIVAGFTVVLAISTIGLWLATNRLWAAGERQMELIAANSAQQSKDMRASINVSRIAAQAALRSANAAIGLELPFLRIEPGWAGFGHFREADKPVVHYFNVGLLKVSNTGRTKAIPVELKCGWTFGEELQIEPIYQWGTWFKVDATVEPYPAEPAEFTIPDLRMDVPEGAYEQLRERQANLWFYVRFSYLDFMKARHDEGFCWHVKVGHGSIVFVTDDTAAYNRKT